MYEGQNLVCVVEGQCYFAREPVQCARVFEGQVEGRDHIPVV